MTCGEFERRFNELLDREGESAAQAPSTYTSGRRSGAIDLERALNEHALRCPACHAIEMRYQVLQTRTSRLEFTPYRAGRSGRPHPGSRRSRRHARVIGVGDRWAAAARAALAGLSHDLRGHGGKFACGRPCEIVHRARFAQSVDAPRGVGWE